MTLQDLQGIIALAINNNKPAFIQALVNNGYSVTPGISDQGLFSMAGDIYAEKGLAAIISIMNQVPKSSFSASQQSKIISAAGAKVDPAAKCDWSHPLDCITGTANWFGDLIGGTSATVTAPTTQMQSSAPALSTTTLVIIGGVGILAIILLRKFTTAVIAISLIVAGIVLYGLFAKKTTTTVSGGGTTTQTHGGWGQFLSSVLPFLV